MMKSKKVSEFIMVLPAALLTVLMVGCKQRPNIVGMLQNPDYRHQIFEEIAKNHETMGEFLDYAITNEHARMMMQSEKGMIEMIMSHNQEMMNFMRDHPELTDQTMGSIIQVATEDSVMLQNIMDMMINDHTMMSSMMTRLHEQGVMDSMSWQNWIEMLEEEEQKKAERSHHQ